MVVKAVHEQLQHSGGHTVNLPIELGEYFERLCSDNNQEDFARGRETGEQKGGI